MTTLIHVSFAILPAEPWAAVGVLLWIVLFGLWLATRLLFGVKFRYCRVCRGWHLHQRGAVQRYEQHRLRLWHCRNCKATISSRRML